MDTKLEIEKLKREVENLKIWKSDKERQQIKFPLDLVSLEILRRYFLYVSSKYTTMGAGSDEFTNLIIKQGTDGFSILNQYPIYTFTANVSDTLTLVSNIFNNETPTLSNDMTVTVFSSDTLPAPLATVTTYYVISVSGNTFKLSTTLGGGAVNITDVGTGTHYIQRF